MISKGLGEGENHHELKVFDIRTIAIIMSLCLTPEMCAICIFLFNVVKVIGE